MAGEPAARLDGWKAIADYLSRDVRTAQRWRDARGMPVHRIPGGKGGAVFADRAEVDAWLLQPTAPANIGGVQPTIEVALPIEDFPNVPLSRPVGVMRLRRLDAPTVRRIAPIAIALVVIGGIAAALVRIETVPSAAPARFEMNAGTLVARDADDSVLWKFPLPEQPGSVVDGPVVNKASLIGTARVMFHGRDSDVLALVALHKVSDAPERLGFFRYQVYCLSANGKLRWLFHPTNRLAFSGREFAGPWRIYAWAALSSPKPRLWISFIDHVWWPSFVVGLDAAGKAETVFVNSGYIAALAPIQVGETTYVLASGVNNEYRSAALAVLDPEGQPSTSPQTAGTPFACDRCPNGAPHRYFLFPRLEVAAANGVPYEYANQINAAANGPIEVSVRDLTALNVRAVYRFSEELMPESVAMSDRYWEIHREMFRAGKLDHSVEDCPERTDGVVVRMWEPDRGWSELKVLPTFAHRETR